MTSHFKLLTRQFLQKLNFKLLTRRFNFHFFLVSSYSKAKNKVTLRVSNLKFNLIFYEVELVTRKKNFYKNFRVSNSKWDVIRNSSSKLKNSEPHLKDTLSKIFTKK